MQHRTRLEILREFVEREGDEIHEELLGLLDAAQQPAAAPINFASHWGEFFHLDELPNAACNVATLSASVLQAGDTAFVRATGFRQSEGLYVCVHPGSQGAGDAVWAPVGASTTGSAWLTSAALTSAVSQLADAQTKIEDLQNKRINDAQLMVLAAEQMREIFESIDFELRTHDGDIADRFGPGAFERLRKVNETFYRVVREYETRKP